MKGAKPYFQCPDCEQVFYYYKTLRKHMGQIHPSSKILNKSKLQVFWMTQKEVSETRKNTGGSSSSSAVYKSPFTEIIVDRSYVPQPAFVICEFCNTILPFEAWPEHYMKLHEN